MITHLSLFDIMFKIRAGKTRLRSPFRQSGIQAKDKITKATIEMGVEGLLRWTLWLEIDGQLCLLGVV